MKLEGGEETKISFPVLVDTGSELLAVCPGNDIGNAHSLSKYSCEAYGDGTYGFNGELFEGTMTLGHREESVVDPWQVAFTLMHNDTSDLCVSGWGIIGVDFDYYDVYDYLPSPPTNKDPACRSDSKSVKLPSFARTMLTPDDNYTMAFIGCTMNNTNDAVLALSKAATDRLPESKLQTSAKIMKNISHWFTLSPRMSFYLDGIPNCTRIIHFHANDTQYYSDYPIVDSGTTELVIPPCFANYFLRVCNLRSDDLFHSTLHIILGRTGVKKKSLEFPLSMFMANGTIDDNLVQIDDQPVLGYPVFWKYDVLFNTGDVQTISFYNRN